MMSFLLALLMLCFRRAFFTVIAGSAELASLAPYDPASGGDNASLSSVVSVRASTTSDDHIAPEMNESAENAGNVPAALENAAAAALLSVPGIAASDLLMHFLAIESLHSVSSCGATALVSNDAVNFEMDGDEANQGADIVRDIDEDGGADEVGSSASTSVDSFVSRLRRFVAAATGTSSTISTSIEGDAEEVDTAITAHENSEGMQVALHKQEWSWKWLQKMLWKV